MKREVSKFKNATFATQIIKKHPLDIPQKKKPLTKILQYPQENTLAGVPLQ